DASVAFARSRSKRVFAKPASVGRGRRGICQGNPCYSPPVPRRGQPVGLMVDSNVFILFERRGQPIDLSHWESSEAVFISAVTVSELLMGVRRADTEARRMQRSNFVEAII